MKNIDCLCFGGCVVDQIEHHERFTLGGDATNQAIVLKRLGLNPILCACTGQDIYSEIIIQKLHDFKLSTDYIIQLPQISTTHSLIHLDEHHERSFHVTGGAHRQFEKKHFPFTLLKQCKAVSLGSLFTLHLLEEDGLLDVLKEAKKQNCLVFSDTSTDRHHKGLKKVSEFLPYIDYFMPSYDEAVQLSGKTDPDEIAKKLIESGANKVIIKLGASGAVLYSKNMKLYCKSYPADVVDTTGAGDHFCAGFIASLLEGKSELEALHNACYIGACATESYGTNNTQIKQLPYPLEKTNSL